MNPSFTRRFDSAFPRLAFAVALGGTLSLAVMGCGDDAVEHRPPAELDLALAMHSVLEAHHGHSEFPGAAMAVHDPVRGESVVTTGAIEPRPDAAPVDPDVPWVIGSATKVFVAVTVLELAEQHALDLDAGIAAYFPQIPRAAAITPRQLLRHTSGLNEYFDAPEVLAVAARPWTPEQLIEVATARGAVGEPGGEHHYANTNYVVLGALVGYVTGNPWYEEVRRRILEPLGMRETHYAGEPGVTPGGPGFRLEDGVFVEPPLVHPSVGGAAGALQSTVPDLLRFARALAEGTLLDESSREEMLSFVPAEPRDYIGHEYGLGFEKYSVRNLTLLGHAGTGIASASFVGYDPESGTTVAVLSNSDESAAPPTMAIEVLGRLTHKDISPPATTE